MSDNAATSATKQRHTRTSLSATAVDSTRSFAFGVSVCLFTLLFFTNSWVGDDAYITLRTVDNFVNGYGLRWNVFERVQAYTHPLWVLLCSVPYFVTREAFFTVIGTSYVICLSTLLLYNYSQSRMTEVHSSLFVLVLMASKSFMDYSSSGLENCLSAFCAVAFVVTSRRLELDPSANAWPVLLAAGFAYVARQDTVLIYLPVCLVVLFSRTSKLSLWRQVVVGISPVAVWTAFSVVYYGFILPNTAYAKALVGIPLVERVKQGVAYVIITALWDPFSVTLLLIFAYAMIRHRNPFNVARLAGVVLYGIYVVVVAASSTTMGLRFISVLVVVAASATLLIVNNRESMMVGAAALSFMLLFPLSPMRTIGCAWSSFELPGWANSSILDMRARVCRDGAALANFQRNEFLPLHAWFRMGMEFKASPERVRWGGPAGLPAMGFFGYAAGPQKTIVDPYGLTDPLIARIPADIPPLWMPGELLRAAPPGYVETLRSGVNSIADPDLQSYYESLRMVTSGPMLSVRRFKEILAMNLGWRNELLRRYEARRQRGAK